MEEQNKAPQAGGEHAPQKSENKNRRNRNRRHHHGHRQGNPNAEAKASAPQQQPEKQKGGQAEPKKPKNEHPAASGQKSAQSGDRKKRRSRHGGGNGNQSHRGIEDLYGKPSENDVLTMEELRAKIVLHAADGSVPAQDKKPEEEVPLTEVEFPGSEALFPMPEDPEPATPAEERVEVVGVRFRSSGKVYYFDPKGLSFHLGDPAIVETARGPEFGEISFANRFVNKKNTVSPLRPVLRAATDADVAHNAENRKKEREAFGICQEKIAAHKLDMKLIDVQYAFDNSRLLFYFTSDGRVDFRDLVKDLASVFRTRIELRQIGIRDEAKMLGGLGICGRPLCCASFLSDFMQVSIKMAKEQGLSLNSAKISGSCGRLMCCLRYESEVYAEELKRCPPYDSTVKTPDGIGTVIGISPLAGTVRVLLKDTPDTPPKQYARDDVTVLPKEKTENGKKSN